MLLASCLDGFSHNLQARILIPVVVVLLQIYAVWAFSHQYCYLQLYVRLDSKGACVGLITVVCFLTLLVWYIWAMILILGPGRQPIIPPFRIVSNLHDSCSDASEKFDNSIPPPDVYICDQNGYPIWCSHCQSLKLARTHHSSKLGYCVPRFDHYCVWIGTVIGRLNYRLFIQFTLYFSITFLIYIISIASKIRNVRHNLNANVYLLLGLASGSLLMTGPLFLTHLYYMCYNRTSLEIIEVKNTSKASRKFFCIYCPTDSYRYVVQFLPGEHQDFWNKDSYMANLKEFMGENYWLWLLPIILNPAETTDKESTDFYNLIGPYEEVISDKYRRIMFEKIERKEYLTRFKI